MKKWIFILIFFSVMKYATALPSQEQLIAKSDMSYANMEHRDIGNLIELKGLVNNLLTLPNGLTLSYGEIVMFAGDFFGDPNTIISQCNLSHQKECFQKHFKTLAEKTLDNDCHSPDLKTSRLIALFESIQLELIKARSEGMTIPEFYTKHSNQLTNRFNTHTCGGSILHPLIPFGDYILLAKNNIDHFVPHSHLAYLVGHNIAIDTAIKSYYLKQSDNSNAIKMLQLAYAQNAWANHYLSDSFASGHIRVPRFALKGYHGLDDIFTLLLANLMHKEDGARLKVHNLQGEHWIAYGDSYLFEPEATEHFAHLLHAMQNSADEIYYAYQTGQIPDNTVQDLFPISDNVNMQPLFIEKQNIIYKRINNFDPSNNKYTKLWSGIETILAFYFHNK